MSVDRIFQFNATAAKHSVTFSQHQETHPTDPVLTNACIHRQSLQEIRSFKLTLFTASAVSQFDSHKEQVDVTMITDIQCKLKKNLVFFILRKCVWKFYETYPLYCSILTVQLAFQLK
jgi:hypothetical protein